jgi:hypothetical protein
MHDPDQPCLAEELLGRLMPALMRAGHVSEETILRLASELEREAQSVGVKREQELGHMALMLRMWAIEAAGTSPGEWRAQRRRKTIRLIKDKP